MNARNIRDALSGIGLLLIIGGIALVVRLCTGCTAREYKPLPSFCYDEMLYTAELVRCVDRSDTLAQSKACRREVDTACGITETVTVKPVTR